MKMNKKIAGILTTLLFLCGCQQAANIPNSNAIVAPGVSNKPYPWKWTPMGKPSPEFEELLKTFKTPIDISNYLIANHAWDDTYDISEFISPQQLFDKHKTVCTGFAKFWQYALARQGVKADFVTMYGSSWAHAIAVFRSPIDGRYHIASNQFYYGDKTQDLDPGNEGRWAAIQASVKFFLEDKALKFEVYDENGNFVVPPVLKDGIPMQNIPGSPSRNIFTVKY